MNKKVAIVYPGQNSQSLKMLDPLLHFRIIQDTFAIAQQVLNIDFLAMLQEDSADNINQTINTQSLMLTSGYTSYLLFKDLQKNQYQQNITIEIMAGHSLGEWTALIASGVLEFEDALKLVYLRAELMQEAVPLGTGKMAAILGLDELVINKICNDIMIDTKQIVSIANFNSIGQVIIAGNNEAVNLAMEQLKLHGAKKVQELSVSVPSHCKLMEGASKKLFLALANIKFNLPKNKIFYNIHGNEINNIDEIKLALVKQLYLPVQWTRLINNIIKHNIYDIIECGPGRVLSSLNKRINSEINSYNLHKEEDFNVKFK